MARNLLDTDILISFSKRRGAAHTWVDAAQREVDELGVCEVVATELLAGARPVDRLPLIRFLRGLTYWDATLDAAIRAGAYRYSFARRGIAVSTPDALIAAVAVDVGATLVTRNVRHYPMMDLTVLVP
jgi:predicted nucleic acid-binding protein